VVKVKKPMLEKMWGEKTVVFKQHLPLDQMPKYLFIPAIICRLWKSIIFKWTSVLFQGS